jgi:hypothetical protein
LKLIKNFANKQTQAKNLIFAKQLKVALSNQKIQLTPKVVAIAFNNHYKTNTAKPHTVRKWLLGQTQPKSETLLLLANWLKVDPKDLISFSNEPVSMPNKVSFEFDFTDQEVISKYLAMTVKEKITVRLVIDAIADKGR